MATAKRQHQDTDLCSVLREIQNKDFSNLFSSECAPECQTYHRIFYLEDCLRRSVVPECLDTLLADESCHVRRLCQRVAMRHGLKTRSMLSDPSHAIRIAHLNITESLDELLQFVDDENRFVRQCILRRIQAPRDDAAAAGNQATPEDRLATTEQKNARKVSIPDSRREEVLLRFNEYINDKDPTVRLEFARALKVFTGLSPKFISKLFDKKNLGLFVYGAEDEIHDVRRELILSIEAFANKGTIGFIFDYLIDMLNDETETVRETVVTVLFRMCKRYDLTVDDNQLRFILSGLEESNSLIQERILGILGYLYYQTVDIFFYLVGQSNIEDAVIFQHLEALVRRNQKLFSENLSSIYKYCVFEEDISPDARISKTSLLYDTEHLARLIVLRTLLKYRSIQISGRTREGFRFLRLKLYGKKPKEDIARAESLRKKIISAIKDQSGDIHVDQTDMTVAERYFWQLSKAVQTYLEFDESDLLHKFSHSFALQNSDGFFKHTFGHREMPLLLARDRRLLKDDAVSHLQAFSSPGSYKRISACKFIVNAPGNIALHRDVPAQFVCFLYFSYAATNIRFVVEDPATKRKMYSDIQEKVSVAIDDCPPVVLCYIAVLYDNIPFKLSNVCETSIISSEDSK